MHVTSYWQILWTEEIKDNLGSFAVIDVVLKKASRNFLPRFFAVLKKLSNVSDQISMRRKTLRLCTYQSGYRKLRKDLKHHKLQTVLRKVKLEIPEILSSICNDLRDASEQKWIDFMVYDSAIGWRHNFNICRNLNHAATKYNDDIKKGFLGNYVEQTKIPFKLFNWKN